MPSRSLGERRQVVEPASRSDRGQGERGLLDPLRHHSGGGARGLLLELQVHGRVAFVLGVGEGRRERTRGRGEHVGRARHRECETPVLAGRHDEHRGVGRAAGVDREHPGLGRRLPGRRRHPSRQRSPALGQLQRDGGGVLRHLARDGSRETRRRGRHHVRARGELEREGARRSVRAVAEGSRASSVMGSGSAQTRTPGTGVPSGVRTVPWTAARDKPMPSAAEKPCMAAPFPPCRAYCPSVLGRYARGRRVVYSFVAVPPLGWERNVLPSCPRRRCRRVRWPGSGLQTRSPDAGMFFPRGPEPRPFHQYSAHRHAFPLWLESCRSPATGVIP